jgi:hypothetical protein
LVPVLQGDLEQAVIGLAVPAKPSITITCCDCRFHSRANTVAGLSSARLWSKLAGLVNIASSAVNGELSSFRLLGGDRSVFLAEAHDKICRHLKPRETRFDRDSAPSKLAVLGKPRYPPSGQ